MLGAADGGAELGAGATEGLDGATALGASDVFGAALAEGAMLAAEELTEGAALDVTGTADALGAAKLGAAPEALGDTFTVPPQAAINIAASPVAASVFDKSGFIAC